MRQSGRVAPWDANEYTSVEFLYMSIEEADEKVDDVEGEEDEEDKVDKK